MGPLSLPYLLNLGMAQSGVPESLLAALKAFWTANSLNVVIAPLYAEGAPPSPVFPLILVDGIDQVLPGETPDDIPVEMYLSAYAIGGAATRALGRKVEDWLDTQIHPTLPIPNPNRPTRFVWSVGAEKFNERDETTLDMDPRMKNAPARLCRYRMHYRFWISGQL